MLTLPNTKPIAGFVPCPECQTLSVVYFPKAGNRAHSPYLYCPIHKTIQRKGIKEYVTEHAVGSLQDYAKRYNVDVSEAQTDIDEHHYLINAQLLDVLKPPVAPAANPVDIEPANEAEWEPIEEETNMTPTSPQPRVKTAPPSPPKVSELPDSGEDEPETGLSWVALLIIVTLSTAAAAGLIWCIRKRKEEKADEQTNEIR